MFFYYFKCSYMEFEDYMQNGNFLVLDRTGLTYFVPLILGRLEELCL